MAKALGVGRHSIGGTGRCFVWEGKDVGPHSAVCGRFPSKVKENGNSNIESPGGR